MNILIPLAGRGSRFNKYNLPKPLINIFGETMISYAVKSLDIEGFYYYITRKYDDYSLNKKLNNLLRDLTPNCRIIEIDYTTEGPASSALLAEDFINNDESLIIANCDRISNWDSKDFLNSVGNSDGVVVTWNNIAPTESYIELDQYGNGIRLAEKQIISDHPLCGIHYWRKGKYFVESARSMISKNIKHNNEFYISETYNQMIESGLKVKIYKLKENQHFSVGSPDDLEKYKQWKSIN